MVNCYARDCPPLRDRMTDKPRILIVEDEPAIRTGLTDVFTYHGFVVTTASDGDAGWRAAQAGRFDLLLLDVMLPGLDGFRARPTRAPASPRRAGRLSSTARPRRRRQ